MTYLFNHGLLQVEIAVCLAISTGFSCMYMYGMYIFFLTFLIICVQYRGQKWGKWPHLQGDAPDSQLPHHSRAGEWYSGAVRSSEGKANIHSLYFYCFYVGWKCARECMIYSVKLFLFLLSEHRGSGSWILRRPRLWRQHQGSGDPAGSDGNDRLHQDVLQGPGELHHLPGELRRGRPHHHLLRWTQPQSRRGLRENV